MHHLVFLSSLVCLLSCLFSLLSSPISLPLLSLFSRPSTLFPPPSKQTNPFCTRPTDLGLHQPALPFPALSKGFQDPSFLGLLFPRFSLLSAPFCLVSSLCSNPSSLSTFCLLAYVLCSPTSCLCWLLAALSCLISHTACWKMFKLLVARCY